MLHFFYVELFSVLHSSIAFSVTFQFLFALPFFHVALFLCCIIFSLSCIFFSCTFFISCCFNVALFCVALFSCCTFFILHYSLVALFSCCFFPVLHYFYVDLFPCCTILCCSFSLLHSFHVALWCVNFFQNRFLQLLLGWGCSMCTTSLRLNVMLHFYNFSFFCYGTN